MATTDLSVEMDVMPLLEEICLDCYNATTRILEVRLTRGAMDAPGMKRTGHSIAETMMMMILQLRHCAAFVVEEIAELEIQQ